MSLKTGRICYKIFEMKKIFLILLVNLILFAVLSAGLVSYLNRNRINNEMSRISFEEFVNKYYKNIKFFRQPEGLKYSKKPVILYGCSFAYGENLDVKDTFSYKLARYARRPVYNYALKGHCIQHMLFFTRMKEHYKDFPEPEYVIYTFIPAHLNRVMNTNYFGNTAYLEYKEQNGHLKRVYAPEFLRNLYITIPYNRYLETVYDSLLDRSGAKRLKLIKLYLEEARRAFNERYPNTKFAVLLYDYSPVKIKNSVWAELRKEGFIVYKASKLGKFNPSDDKYKLPENIDKYRHPNGAAWDKIVPALSKELNL